MPANLENSAVATGLDENPSQGPWEPGALGAALILGGLETAGGALQLPFPSL